MAMKNPKNLTWVGTRLEIHKLDISRLINKLGHVWNDIKNGSGNKILKYKEAGKLFGAIGSFIYNQGNVHDSYSL